MTAGGFFSGNHGSPSFLKHSDCCSELISELINDVSSENEGIEFIFMEKADFFSSDHSFLLEFVQIAFIKTSGSIL